MKNQALSSVFDRNTRQFGKVSEFPVSFRPPARIAVGIRALQHDFPHLTWSDVCNNLLAEKLKDYGYLPD